MSHRPVCLLEIHTAA